MHGGFNTMPERPKLVSLTEYLQRAAAEMTERARTSVPPPVVPASFPLGRAWFVVCVLGRWEALARADIEALGFEVFCPIERKTKILRGRKTEVTEPVFPGYLFASFDRERDSWGSIAAVDGVLDIIMNLGLPVRVPDAVIERLRNADAAGVFDAANKLSDNERVEIMEGPFAGLFARVKSASKKDRVKILLDCLGAIDIDPCFLRKAE